MLNWNYPTDSTMGPNMQRKYLPHQYTPTSLNCCKDFGDPGSLVDGSLSFLFSPDGNGTRCDFLFQGSAGFVLRDALLYTLAVTCQLVFLSP